MSAVWTRRHFSRALAVLALVIPGIARPVPVNVTGLGETETANVLAHLTLDDEPCTTPRWRIDGLMEDARDEIRIALEALGYYEPSTDIAADFSGDCPTVSISVSPGTPVRFRDVDVRISGEAQSDREFRSLLDALPATSGERLRHDRIAEWKKNLGDLAVERGYADAGFKEVRLDVYPAAHAADLTIHFDSGPRFDFGELHLDQSVLREEFLLRYIQFEPGDPFDRRELRELYVTLVSTGFFESVIVRPEEPVPDQHVIPVTIALTPSRPTTYTFGAGLSTDTGPRIRLAYLNRRANDRGWQRGAELTLSPVVSELSANLRVPVGDPRLQWLAFNGGFKYEDSDSVRSDSFQLGARHIGTMRGRWRETQFIDLLYEDFTVAGQSDTSRLLIPGLNWVRKHGDEALFPHRGYSVALTTKGAWDGFLSDASFLQFMARLKGVTTVFGESRVLARLHLGATAVDSVTELPASLRFFAGGDNSVRGYAYQSLGPENDVGQVVGGTRLITASLEYEHPLTGAWSVAGFVDSGNAFDEQGFEAKTGAGVGVRWRSPVGPVRFDLAFPLDDAEDSFQIHISMGPDL